MAVDARKIEMRLLQDMAGQAHGLAVGDAVAELAVVLAGHDELVRVRGDARLDAEQHALVPAVRGADALEAGDLLVVVDDDAADAGGDGHLQLGVGLVVAVEMEVLRIKTGLDGRIELAAGDDVRMDALGGEDRIDERGAQRLAGVGDLVALAEVAAHRLGEGAAVFAQAAFAHHIGRRAVFAAEVDQIDAVHQQMAVAAHREVLVINLFHFVPRPAGSPTGPPPCLFVFLLKSRSALHRLPFQTFPGSAPDLPPARRA